MIPVFPEFKAIDLHDKEPLQQCLLHCPTEASEYTFTNLFAWRQSCGYQLARYGEGVVIRKESHGVSSFLQPLVTEGREQAVADCLAYLEHQADVPVVERVCEDFLEGFDDAGFTIEEDRAQFDYLYDVQELIELPGERFHDKKNLLAQFEKKYSSRYLPLTKDRVDDCLAFAHAWCEDKHCEQSEGLTQENCAVAQMLTHYDALSFIGGLLEVDGGIAAFTLAEPLNPDTLVIHVEKAKTGITGIYQAINREFLRHAGGGYRFVNREQDLGVEGLRKAKLSYNPVRLVKKYRIRRRTTNTEET